MNIFISINYNVGYKDNTSHIVHYININIHQMADKCVHLSVQADTHTHAPLFDVLSCGNSSIKYKTQKYNVKYVVKLIN